MRRRRCEDGGSKGGQLAAARDEIGMKMRLHGKRNSQVEAFRELQVVGRIPTRVNDQRPAAAERQQIRGVSEPLVDKGHDLRAVDLDGEPAHQLEGSGSISMAESPTSLYIRTQPWSCMLDTSRPPFADSDHRKACGLPLRQPVFQPSGAKAGLP